MNLSFLIENECYRTAPLLETDQFISLCKQTGLITSREDLEFYEKQKIFFPIFRIKFPELTCKIEYTEDKKQFRYLGVLKKDEKWNGAVKKERASFSQDPASISSFLEVGLLWEPCKRKYLSWKYFRTKDWNNRYENYYSKFQIFHLYLIKSSMRIGIGYQYLLSKDFKPLVFVANEKKYARKRINSLQNSFGRLNSISYLCQCISNRYYPQTQSDRRNISITLTDPNWDWYKFRREWKANAFIEQLSIPLSDIESYHSELLGQSSHVDPIEHWHDLSVFVNIDKRRRLKGDAFLAEQLYAMEMMIRMFIFEATGNSLDAPHYCTLTDIPHNHGVKDEKQALKYLEFTINRYHLNPQPRLLVVCEGFGEEEQFPRIITEHFGYDTSVLGISFVNLKGVGNFKGGLKGFIDYHHSRNTIVYVIGDNEGNTQSLKDRLIQAPSSFDPGRNITNNDYFTIWNTSFEYDNFTNDEIAQALNTFSDGRYTFTEDDIDITRQKAVIGRNHDLLSKLYKERTQYSLSKTSLAKILVDNFLESNEKDKTNKPFVEIMRRVIVMAQWNSPPNSNPERDTSKSFWFSKDNQTRKERFCIDS